MLYWLKDEHRQGRPVDILAQDDKHDPQWFVINSGSGSAEAGVLFFISTKLVRSDEIRSVALHAGRALHVRLMLNPPLDLLNVYQYAWNPNKQGAEQGQHKMDALLKQRMSIWKSVRSWLGSIPRRHGCILLGDFNTPLSTCPGLVGGGVAKRVHKPMQTDHEEFQQIIQQFACIALNTWSQAGDPARTFIPAVAGDGHGTQIDFVLSRGRVVDGQAKQATPFTCPMVPATGCRHLPVQCSIRRPRLPMQTQQAVRQQPQQVSQLLQERELAAKYVSAATQAIADMGQGDSLDNTLRSSWQQCLKEMHKHKPRGANAASQEGVSHHSVCLQIRSMWDLRAELRLNDTKRSYNKGISLKEVLQGWLQAARLQQVTREVRKAGRLRKLQKIEQVLRSTNIYRAAKTLAPKAPRRRMQIRDKNGRIQTAHADFEQILQYFQQLYSGPQADSIVLDTPLLFTTDDVQQAVHRLSVSKVMPAASAPAALWRLLERPAATKLTQQFNQDFSGGPIVIPDLWNVSELVLLPKPFKPLKSPADLRPIALLPPEIKVLSTILAERIRPYALQYLADIPQLAYLAGRSLQQALHRVISHCAQVRASVASQAINIHGRRAGQGSRPLCGGLMLSLDISV